jgi:P4 family phage/plasmid primase-like protien
MTTAALSSPKDHALRYHDMGFSVLVLKNPETGTEIQLRDRKRPALNWELYQIMRPSKIQIERWFAKNPNYNLALVMGSISGNALGLDIDGLTARKRVEEKRVEMSRNLMVAFDDTMVNRTGSGGMHVIFRVDGDPIDDISPKTIWNNNDEAHSQIRIQANGSYVAAAPSRHPNGKHYEWNGKSPQLITRQELYELIRLLSPPGVATTRPPQTNIPQNLGDRQAEERTLSPEQMQELLPWVKPYYNPGTRNDIIFYLSGMMRKTGGFTKETARRFIKLLCNSSGYPDEDLDKSLTVVDNTYRKPLEDLNGKSGLHDLLVKSYEASTAEYDKEEYEQRAEAFSQICQIINPQPTTTPPEDPSSSRTSGGDGGDDNNDDNNNKKLVMHSGAGLLRDKTVEDTTTREISFLAPEVKKRATFKTLFDTREILYFDKSKKYYRFGGEAIIDSEIEKIIVEIHAPFSVRSYVKGEVRKSIADSTLVHREEFDADPYTVNLENCLLDIISLKQMEHTPEYLTMSKFPVTYDPAAECPRIEKFLGDVIQDPHKLREKLKFWASVLLKDCRFEKGLMCLGGGGNGKSKFIRLLEIAVGEDNCSHLSLHDVEEDRFARARLFGKVLNTYADNKSQRLKETGNLKTVISGDSIEGQNKFKPRFSFRNRAKFVISTNKPPETEDKTYAYYRRWDITSFDNTFVPSDDPNAPNRADPDILDKITTTGELSGWLNLGLAYLPVLLREGFAQEPMDQVKKEYERMADHVSRYIQNYCVIDPSKKDFYTSSERVYDHYVRVCENDNIKPLDKNVFGSRLVEHSIEHKRKRIKGSRDLDYVYIPLRLKHELRQEQDSIIDGKSGLFASSAVDTTTSAGIPTTAEEQSAISSGGVLECPHCALPGNYNPIHKANSLRDLQLHIIFRHPDIDFKEITEE